MRIQATDYHFFSANPTRPDMYRGGNGSAIASRLLVGIFAIRCRSVWAYSKTTNDCLSLVVLLFMVIMTTVEINILNDEDLILNVLRAFEKKHLLTFRKFREILETRLLN